MKSDCGCNCTCHPKTKAEEEVWPGPCAACCEPGDKCICGTFLSEHGIERSTLPSEFTDPEYTKRFYETHYDEGTSGER